MYIFSYEQRYPQKTFFFNINTLKFDKYAYNKTFNKKYKICSNDDNDINEYIIKFDKIVQCINNEEQRILNTGNYKFKIYDESLKFRTDNMNLYVYIITNRLELKQKYKYSK